MDEIIPHLWIGDLACALAPDYLSTAGVTHILTAMKQRLPPPPTLPCGRRITADAMHHVRIDDVEDAPMFVHFPSAIEWMREVLQERWIEGEEGEEGWWEPSENVVYVHCQAGVSRSVALVLAYLMNTRGLTLDDALALVRSRRPQADPNSGFIQQLQLYEAAGCVVDMRHQAIRRFLMSQTSILNGDSIDDVLLAYYPSPFPSPAVSKSSSSTGPLDAAQRRRSSSAASSSRDRLAPFALSRTSSLASETAISLSSRTSEGGPDLSVSPELPEGAAQLLDSDDAPPENGDLFSSITDAQEVKVTASMGKLPGGVAALRGNEGPTNRGSLPNPVFHGPKLRCRMCRRELAARDHVIEHEAGRGQSAFATRKRMKDLGEREREGRAIGSTSASAQLDAEQKFGAKPRRVVGLEADESASVTGETTPQASTEPADSAPSDAAGAALASPSAGRPLHSAAALTASLPPALAALRLGRAGSTAAAAPSGETSASRMLHSPACSAYFVEPLAWMEALRAGEISGRLDCPGKRCGAKLGSYDWAGLQCSCGYWQVPAFGLHRSRVDEVA